MKVLLLSGLLLAVLVANVSGACRFSSQHQCDDGTCVFGDECDGSTDCDDGSDEQNCVNVGLAVGLTIFFFVLFCVVCPIGICVLIWCCVAGALGAAFRSNQTTTTTVATTAPAGGQIVTTTETGGMTQTAYPPTQDYPPPYSGQPYPAQTAAYPAQPGYPPQQPYPAQPYPPKQ